MSGAAKLCEEERSHEKLLPVFAGTGFFFFFGGTVQRLHPARLRVCTRSTSLMKQSGCKGSSTAKRHKTNSRLGTRVN